MIDQRVMIFWDRRFKEEESFQVTVRVRLCNICEKTLLWAFAILRTGEAIPVPPSLGNNFSCHHGKLVDFMSLLVEMVLLQIAKKQGMCQSRLMWLFCGKARLF